MAFSDSARIYCPLTDVLTPEGLGKVLGCLDQIAAAPMCGGTNIADGLRKCDEVLGPGAPGRKIINLASNGNPTVGDDPIPVCETLKSQGIVDGPREIWTLGIPPGADDRLLCECSGPGPGKKCLLAKSIDQFELAEISKLMRIIPTLSEWGMIVLATLFIGTSIAWMIRKRRASNAIDK